MLQGFGLEPQAEKKIKHFNRVKDESEVEEKETGRERERGIGRGCMCMYVLYSFMW